MAATDGQAAARPGAGSQVWVPAVPDPSLRLRAVADLFSERRHGIVVASSPARCCRGYSLAGASSAVVDY